jgi:translation initiation factor IF-3
VDAEGRQVGIVPIEEALRKAQEVGLDLVEVASEAQPPVCRIFDYRKILYEQKRRQKESRKKAHQVVLKEIKIRVTIDRHDLNVKARHARQFLEDGDKVKLTIQFRGREITKHQLADQVIAQFMAALQDIAEIEQGLTRQGRQQHLVLTRRRESLPKKAAESDEAPHLTSPAPAPAPSTSSGGVGNGAAGE